MFEPKRYNKFIAQLTQPSPRQLRKIRNRENLKNQEQKQNSTAGLSFEDELNEFSSIRLSMHQPSTSTATVTSESPIKSPTSIISIPDDDSEIEEGEIVEREVTQCVDLIEESFCALRNSRKIQDLSPIKKPLFFEDRGNDEFKHVPAPLYNSIEEVSLNSTTNSNDDSVIFVSEQSPLEKPKGLLSPAINELMKLSGVKLTPLVQQKQDKKLLSPSQIRRRERVAKWRQKKHMEHAQREVAEIMGRNDPQPSTSSTPVVSVPIVKVDEKKKRIILIDGSNVAITHAKSTLGKGWDDKSPKAFSVEGLNISLKHFESMGFQVKAVLPEYRLNRDKSSNQKLLHQLKEEGSLIPTPSKSYDDRILLESASRLNAAVVSNDFFRDFKSDSKFLEVLNNRQIRYNWVFSEFVLAEDSYGRNGPRLQDILYIPN